LRRAIAGIGILVASCALIGCGLKTNPRPYTAPIPNDVGLVTVQVFPGNVELRWDKPRRNTDGSEMKDLAGFNVYRSSQEIGEACDDCDEAGGFHAKIDLKHPMTADIKNGEVVYKDQRISLGHTYYYAISAYNKKDREGPRCPVITVAYDSLPPSPKGLRATYDRGIVLRWDKPSRPSGIRAYRVYRGKVRDQRKLEPIGRTKWAEKFYVDTDVEKDTPYYYVVRSMKMTGGIPIESAPSQMVQATYPRVIIKAPRRVKAASTSRGIRIFWDQVRSENEAIRYNVYRSEGERQPEKINRQPLQNAWVTDSKVKKGHRYRYEVTAFPLGKPEEESRRTASEEITHQY
jgi:hypothetical protein